MSAAFAPTGASVEDFLAAVPNQRRREDAERLVEILSELTGEPPVLWGSSIVGFGSIHYRYDTGREGDSPLVAFAPRKAELVLYVGGDEDERAEILGRLGPHRTGVVCVYVKRLDDLDPDVLVELLRFGIADGSSQHVETGSCGPGVP